MYVYLCYVQVNHAEEPNCEWDYDETGVVIKTDETIEKDEELFIDYGETFNSELARIYGFTVKRKQQYFEIDEK